MPIQLNLFPIYYTIVSVVFPTEIFSIKFKQVRNWIQVKSYAWPSQVCYINYSSMEGKKASGIYELGDEKRRKFKDLDR